MQDPHNIYHDPIVQERIVTHGTREQVIAWLDWNDRNGVYLDDDCDAENMPRLTLERARDCMREQMG